MKKATYIKPSVILSAMVQTSIIAATTMVSPGQGEEKIPVTPGQPSGGIDAKPGRFNIWEDDEEDAGVNDRF